MRYSFQPNKAGYAVIVFLIVVILSLALKKRDKIKDLAMDTLNYLKEKTWDWRTDAKIKKLHPLVQAKAKEFIIRAEKELGIKLRISSALRTWKEQDDLYAYGRTKEGTRKTNAKGGQSFHNYGLAFDLVEIKEGKAIWDNPRWNEIAKLGKSLGFEWGGDWRSFVDKPHFQYTFGKSLAQLQDLYTSGNRKGEYVNIA